MEKVRKGPRCAMFAPPLPAEDLERLRAALKAPEVATSSIWRWLDKKNVDVGIETVKRHRRGECYCRREV
jgi:hypothetical protein